jgi:hypothetical protein
MDDRPTIHVSGLRAEANKLSLNGLGRADDLIVEGTNGADTTTVAQTPDYTRGLGTIVAVEVGGEAWLPVDFAFIEGLNILATGGDDELIVDNTHGLVLPDGNGINYDGGQGEDSLRLIGSTTVDASSYDVGPDPDEGMIMHELDGSVQTVRFTGLEPLLDTVSATSLTVNGTNDGNAINYTRAGADSGFGMPNAGLVAVDAFETIEFLNKAELIINGAGGDDTINIRNSSTPSGLTGISILGGDATASDTLVVNGTTGQDEITFSPSQPDAGMVEMSGLPSVAFDTVETLKVNGLGGDDTLVVETPAGTDSLTEFTPGAEVDAGTFAVDSLIAAEFSNLGSGGLVRLVDPDGGADGTLLYRGSFLDDVFEVESGTGTVGLQTRDGRRIDVATVNVGGLILAGSSGDDIFNLEGPQPYEEIVLEGGNPSSSDIANLSGDGSGITVDIGAADGDAIVGGAGLGTVHLNGMELVELDLASGDLDVAVTSSDDTVQVTPLDGDNGMLRTNEFSPRLDFYNVDTFTVDTGGARDVLSVIGTSGADTIEVNGTAVEIVGRETVNYVGVEALQILSRAGTDTITVDNPTLTEVFVDGGDPIGHMQGTGDVLDIISGGSPFAFEAGPESDEGRLTVADNGATSFDHIELLMIDGVPFLLPDEFEPNDSIAEATVLGSLPKITLRGLTLHNQGGGVINEDYFQITAQDTGKLIFNAFFEDNAAAGLGDVNISIVDATGDVVADSVTITDDEQIIIPVVSQEQYYLHVFSANVLPNTYDLEIENFEATIPNSVDLVAEDDTGLSNEDDLTLEDESRILIEADLTGFADDGIAILTAAEATGGVTAGAAVQVFVDGVSVGFAEPVGATNDDLYEFTFAPGDLAEGVNYVKAAVTVIDGQVPSAEGRTELSNPLVLALDTILPDTPLMPDLVPSSDTGLSNSDNVTSDVTPTLALEGFGTFWRLERGGVQVSADFATGNMFTDNPLPDGLHPYVLYAVDAAGNVSVGSAPLDVTVDTVAPDTPSAPDLQAASDSGISNSDDITNVQSPIFDVTSTDAFYRFYRSGILISDEYESSPIFTSSMEFEGDHRYTVGAVDLAGNESEMSMPLSVLVDRTAPAAPLPPDLQAATDTGNSADNITANRDVAFNVDVIPPAKFFRIYRDGTLVSTAPIFGDDGEIYKDGASEQLSDQPYGLFEYRATAVDEAGNESSPSRALEVKIQELWPIAWKEYEDGTFITVYDVDPSNGISDPTIAWVGCEFTNCADIMIDHAGNNQIRWIALADGNGSMEDVGIVIENVPWIPTVYDARTGAPEDLGLIASDAQIGEAFLASDLIGGQLNGFITEGGWQLPADVDRDGDVSDLTGWYTDATTVTLEVNGDIIGDVGSRDGQIWNVISRDNDVGITGDVFAGGNVGWVVAEGGSVTGDVMAECWVQGVVSLGGDLDGTIMAEKGIGTVLAIDGDMNADIISGGGISDIYTSHDLTGDITVSDYLGSVTVDGSMTDSNVTVAGDYLGSVSVGGSITDSRIRVEDDNGDLSGYLHSVYARGDLRNSTIEARNLGSVYVEGGITEDGTDGDTDIIRALDGAFYVQDSTGDGGWVYNGQDRWFDGLRAFIDELNGGTD